MDKNPQDIKMGNASYKALLAEANARAPLEACGLVAGTDIDGVRIVRKVYMLENIDHSPEHFRLDPKQQLEAVKDMRQNGLKPLGNWHSHPKTPCRPSEEDKRLAFDKNATYFILSLANEKPELQAFHIEGNESRKENLEIIE